MPASLNHEDIGKNPQRISKIKLFITKYNLDGIEAPAGPKDWKKFEQNNKTIAFNILYVTHNTEQIHCAYKSKYYDERENQAILLMITDSKRSDGIKKWHYLALKSEPVLYNGKMCNRPLKSLSRLLKWKITKSYRRFLLFELF